MSDKEKPIVKVLIDVQGGLVQEVFANAEVEVTLLDWDNIKEGPELDLIELGNYGYDLQIDDALQQKIDEANKIITQNIEWSKNG